MISFFTKTTLSLEYFMKLYLAIPFNPSTLALGFGGDAEEATKPGYFIIASEVSTDASFLEIKKIIRQQFAALGLPSSRIDYYFGKVSESGELSLGKKIPITQPRRTAAKLGLKSEMTIITQISTVVLTEEKEETETSLLPITQETRPVTRHLFLMLKDLLIYYGIPIILEGDNCQIHIQQLFGQFVISYSTYHNDVNNLAKRIEVYGTQLITLFRLINIPITVCIGRIIDERKDRLVIKIQGSEAQWQQFANYSQQNNLTDCSPKHFIERNDKLLQLLQAKQPDHDRIKRYLAEEVTVEIKKPKDGGTEISVDSIRSLCAALQTNTSIIVFEINDLFNGLISKDAFSPTDDRTMQILSALQALLQENSSILSISIYLRRDWYHYFSKILNASIVEFNFNNEALAAYFFPDEFKAYQRHIVPTLAVNWQHRIVSRNDFFHYLLAQGLISDLVNIILAYLLVIFVPHFKNDLTNDRKLEASATNGTETARLFSPVTKSSVTAATKKIVPLDQINTTKLTTTSSPSSSSWWCCFKNKRDESKEKKTKPESRLGMTHS